MSKAVLIMDMPESCRECDLRVIGANNFCTGASGRKIDQMTIINEGIKSDWCPLRLMPEKAEKRKTDNVHDIIIKQGWNACIDELTDGSSEEGFNETNKETHQST